MRFMLQNEWEKGSTVKYDGDNVHVYPPEQPFDQWLIDNELTEDE